LYTLIKHNKLAIAFSLFSIFCFSPTIAQQKIYETKRLNSTEPLIDGVFNDEAWNLVQWEGDFIQREPYDGEPPSQKTIFKILYDDNNLYVAIKAEDTEPEEIEKRLTRRDEFEGDWVAIGIDSYYDKLTGFGFAVTAAGVMLRVMLLQLTILKMMIHGILYGM